MSSFLLEDSVGMQAIELRLLHNLKQIKQKIALFTRLELCT